MKEITGFNFRLKSLFILKNFSERSSQSVKMKRYEVHPVLAQESLKGNTRGAEEYKIK